MFVVKTTKALRKLLSAVLAVVLLLGCVQPAAAATETENLSEIPIVEVLGAFHELYYNPGTPQQTRAFNGASFEGVFTSLLGEAFLELYKQRLSDLSPYALTDTLADILREPFEILAFNPDGTPVHELGGNELANQWYLGNRPYGQNPTGDWRPLTMDRMYLFDFDWRLSPLVLAEQLHEYIQDVKQHSGYDKVNLSLQSGSAGVGLAYLERYGTQDLNAYWSMMPIHSSTLFGEVINKRIHFDEEALFTCTVMTGMNNETVQKVLEVLKYFDDAGLLRVAFGGAYIVLRPTMVNRLFEKLITPDIASMPILWSYVPAKDHYSGINATFGSDREKYAGLIAQLNEYHERVGSRQSEILAKAAKEIPVGMLAAYGSSLVPLVQGSNVNSDTVVDLRYATLGATSSAPDSVLTGSCGKPYAQQVQDGHNHLSPDGQVDASTCLLPETTWFSNEAQHFTVWHIKRLRNWFYDTKDATVHSNPAYPQFLQINPAFRWYEAARQNTWEYYADTSVPVPFFPMETPAEPEPETLEASEQFVKILLKIVSVFLYVMTWWMDYI